jgi:hypothetical protein
MEKYSKYIKPHGNASKMHSKYTIPPLKYNKITLKIY